MRPLGLQCAMPWPPAPPPARSPLKALAVVVLVLGILSIVMSPVLVGGLTGLLGLTLAVVYLCVGTGHRAMTLWGTALCALGIVLSSAMGYVYYRALSAAATTAWHTEPGWRGGGGRDMPGWQGTPAPPLVVTTLDGERIDLAALKGRRVVVNFWATWCAACRTEMPGLDRLARESDDAELVVVAVSEEDKATLAAYARKENLTLPLASADDRDLPSPFDEVKSIPTTAFIDRQGIITAAVVGALDHSQLRERAFAPDLPERPE
jgi:peroxiredoxin